MDDNQTNCASCGAEVFAEDQTGRFPAHCPACGEMLVFDDEPTETEASELPESDELEESNIIRIVRARRAQVRTRGYYIAFLLACVIGVVQLAARLYQGGPAGEMVGYAAALVLLLLIARTFFGKLQETSARLKESALTEPTTPPDFDSLSNGSQHTDKLEEFGGSDRHTRRP